MSSVASIGKNLSRHRERRGLTLTGLAENSGVAKSTLSQLESGSGNPTVETLWAIANALGVPFGSLVNETEDNAGEVLEDGVSVRFIERSNTDPEIEVYLMELQAGRRKESAPHPEGVKERVTMLAGSLLVGDPRRPCLIRPGDSIQFEADQPHLYIAPEQPARAMVVIEYPPKAMADSASTQYMDWPQHEAAWDGVRAAVNRALIECCNGCAVRVVRFHRTSKGAGEQALTLLRELVRTACESAFAWPLLVLVEADRQGPFLVIIPLRTTSAFGGLTVQTPGLSLLNQQAHALARLAETACVRLSDKQLQTLHEHVQEHGWTLGALGAEVLLQREGLPALPAQLQRQNGRQHGMVPAPSGEQTGDSFSSRINVAHYDAYELLHPAYARQVVAVAEDIATFANPQEGSVVVDVGTGPGVPLLMLHELHPALHFMAIEPDHQAFACLQDNLRGVQGISALQIGFLDYRESGLRLITSVGASHHFNTAFMMQHAARLLGPGGVLIVADEFLPEYASPDERNRALVLHHGGYLLTSIASMKEDVLTSDDSECLLYREARRSISMAYVAATEGNVAQAMTLCRTLLGSLQQATLGGRPTHPVGYFIRFYILELQAMIAGFDYEVERKTFPRRFVEFARFAGLELMRHRRVFATTGSHEDDGGTHVFCFCKPAVLS